MKKCKHKNVDINRFCNYCDAQIGRCNDCNKLVERKSPNDKWK